MLKDITVARASEIAASNSRSSRSFIHHLQADQLICDGLHNPARGSGGRSGAGYGAYLGVHIARYLAAAVFLHFPSKHCLHPVHDEVFRYACNCGADHRNLAMVIDEQLRDSPWIITYDDSELIRDIYKQYLITEYEIQHNVGGTVHRKELVITNIRNESFVWRKLPLTNVLSEKNP